MIIRCTVKGYVGLLVGLAAAAFYLWSTLAGTTAQGPNQAKGQAPVDRIDVEQSVDFPYDI